jgi:GFO/IDH/MocA oxidoreductase family protein
MNIYFKDGKMIRIGVVNIDVSHPKAFSELLMKGNRARYVAVYNDGFREDDEVDNFVQTANLEKRCDSVEELADMVDIGFIQGCNWDKHVEYAKIFINKGKPVFIDKPIVGSIRDCQQLEELVASGAKILGSSSVRYATELKNFLSIPKEERGEILSLTGSAGVDEFNYAIHTVEGLCALTEGRAVSTTFLSKSSREDAVNESFLIKFDNGINAVYHTHFNVWLPFDFSVITTMNSWQIRLDTGNLYGPMLERICDFMETGSADLASVNSIVESVKVMLAGRLSREQGGVEVLLDDIPEDDPGFNGDLFEKGYAAKAKKIYM